MTPNPPLHVDAEPIIGEMHEPRWTAQIVAGAVVNQGNSFKIGIGRIVEGFVYQPPVVKERRGIELLWRAR